MPDSKASTPIGVNHLVLNVRDMEASHRFYTEVLGYEQVGELGDVLPMTMRFYSTHGKHHDVALVEQDKPDPPDSDWSMGVPNGRRINHFAIAYPDRDSFLNQLRHLQECGVDFKVRGDHGMTHSVYINDPDGNGIEVLYELPRELWEGDVNAALNYFKPLPVEGPEALEDTTDYVKFGES